MARRTRGEGTVTRWKASKRPETDYRARISITLPSGEKREIYGYGPTAKAAIADRKTKLELAMKGNPSPKTITLTQVFAKLMQHKQLQGRKKKTIFNDIELYKRHIRPHLGTKPISEITLEDLQLIQYRLIKGKKYRTAELVTILFKSSYKYALKLYRKQIYAGEVNLVNIAEDLEQAKRPPQAKMKQYAVWTEEQLQAFLEESERQYDEAIQSLYHPLFHTAISAGLRRGELLGLTWDAIKERTQTVGGEASTQHYLDISKQLIYYGKAWHEDTPKTEGSTREVPIGQLLWGTLKRHREKLEKIKARNPKWEEHNLVFSSYNGKPISPNKLYDYYYRIIKQLGLPEAKLHTLRKIYTTYITRKLVQSGRYSPRLVQKLLGHNSHDVALSVYTLLIQEDYNAATFDPLDVLQLEKEEA